MRALHGSSATIATKDGSTTAKTKASGLGGQGQGFSLGH